MAGQPLQSEYEALCKALARIIEPDAVADWFQVPNAAFDGLKPIEVIERGESDRLWRMVFDLESGVPS